jgi:branched-chain amino acid transport system substrate-binding protein
VGRAILAGAYKGSDGVNAVRLAVEDDQCTAEGGAAVAAKFVTLKVDAVVGHPCSNAAIAAAQVYAAAGIAFVAIGADHPDLTDKRAGPTIFRSSGRRDRQAADTVATFASALTGRRVAIINDYSALITQLAATRIEAIYFAGFPSEAILIMKGLLDADLKALLIGCDALDDPLIAAEAGHRANTAVMVATSDIAIIAHETAQLVRNWSPLKRYDGSVLPPFPVDKKGDRQDVRSYHAINPITGKPFWPLF